MLVGKRLDDEHAGVVAVGVPSLDDPPGVVRTGDETLALDVRPGRRVPLPEVLTVDGDEPVRRRRDETGHEIVADPVRLVVEQSARFSRGRTPG